MVRRPACAAGIAGERVTGPHDPHPFLWTDPLCPGVPDVAQCGGCTPRDAAGLAVVDAAHAAVRDGSAAGACIECSPLAAAALAGVLEPGLADMTADPRPGAVVESLFGIPVVVTAELGLGAWRLTPGRPAGAHP